MKSFFQTTIWPLKDKLYRLAFLWVKDRDVAQDLLQEVFEKALKNESKLQKLNNPVGWMVRCLKNESMQHHRTKRNFVSIDDREFQAENVEKTEPEAELKRVFLFLESLPEKQREVFQLREVEGLTYDEIGDYLEIPIEQVKVCLFRARRKLRALLLKKSDER
jgi:RNA polymerase sigma-70 factor (ECF subfamily)